MAQKKKKQHADDPMAEQLVKQDLITREELDEARLREDESGIPWWRQMIQTQKLDFSVVSDILKHEFHPASVKKEHSNLGNTLVEMKLISKDDLESALDEQRRNGRLLGNILMDRGVITHEMRDKALARQHGLEYTSLADAPSEKEALEAVSEAVSKRNQMIPVKLEGDRLTVLIASPQVVENLQDASVILGYRMYPIMTTAANIKSEIGARYKALREGAVLPGKAMRTGRGRTTEPAPEPAATTKSSAKGAKKKKGETVATRKETAEAAAAKLREKLNFDEIARQAQGMPVIKLVQTIIEGAANSGATDIHLDPQEPEMRVRYRIDGVLHDVMSIPEEIQNAVLSRIKILSDMDITETRHPQDGHIGIEVGDQEFDIRVATLPCYLGERVVLRMLDQTSVLQGIRDLGLDKDAENKLSLLIEQPYGMILVTGPTGSGKTTTLYAALNQKNVLEDSIVTLEDPVEYQLSGINQVQIETDIGITFASTLRAALRQDIDVLLVGEIRDPDTARIAIRASMTGHLVFSTLHTNDAPEAISTLRNMNVPSYLIGSALTAVLAQRLVRKICPKCRASFTPTKAQLQSLGLATTVKKLFRGKGCDNCYGTGNKGRTGIFEVLEVTPQIRAMIAADEPVEKITKTAKLKTMADSCRQKMKDGEVAPEEFLRVIRT